MKGGKQEITIDYCIYYLSLVFGYVLYNNCGDFHTALQSKAVSWFIISKPIKDANKARSSTETLRIFKAKTWTNGKKTKHTSDPTRKHIAKTGIKTMEYK